MNAQPTRPQNITVALVDLADSLTGAQPEIAKQAFARTKAKSLNLEQILLIREIRAGQHRSIAALSAATDQPTTAVRVTIRSLVNRGLIELTPSPGTNELDRTYQVTTRYTTVVTEVRQQWHHYFQYALASLSAEHRATLENSGEALGALIDAMGFSHRRQ
ncbi:MarR family transcriptional regulator [Nakamurella silvestris]|nr:MarR family transcriptional regulator [Nakamurella silvestris]